MYTAKTKHDEQVSYELAGFWDRLIAIAVDSIILGIIGGLFAGLRIGLLGSGSLTMVVGVIYHWYFLTQHDGQTPGKMLLGIRVISTTGGKIGDIDAGLRYLGYYLNSAIFMLGWVWALIDSNRQGWHDKLARTYVVRANSVKVKTVIINNGEKSKNETII